MHRLSAPCIMRSTTELTRCVMRSLTKNEGKTITSSSRRKIRDKRESTSCCYFGGGQNPDGLRDAFLRQDERSPPRLYNESLLLLFSSILDTVCMGNKAKKQIPRKKNRCVSSVRVKYFNDLRATKQLLRS